MKFQFIKITFIIRYSINRIFSKKAIFIFENFSIIKITLKNPLQVPEKTSVRSEDLFQAKEVGCDTGTCSDRSFALTC